MMFDVLSIQQIDTLIQKYDPVQKRDWKHEYNRIKKLYTRVCVNCQNVKPGNISEEVSLLEDIASFLDSLVRNIIPIMKESTEMKNAMTLMLFKKKNALDTSFWLSHRTSQRLGIKDKDLQKLGASDYDETLTKVRKFIIEKNNENIYDYESLEFAYTCYKLDFEARELFAVNNSWEGGPKHIFRKNLARALKVVLAELIESMDV